MVEMDKNRKQYSLQRISTAEISGLSPLKESPEVKRKKVKTRVRPRKLKQGVEGTEASFDEDDITNNLDGEVKLGTPLEPIHEADEDHSPNLERNQRPRLKTRNQDLFQIQTINVDGIDRDNLSK